MKKLVSFITVLLVCLAGFLMEEFNVNVNVRFAFMLHDALMYAGITGMAMSIICAVRKIIKNIIAEHKRSEVKVWYACDKLEQLIREGHAPKIERGSAERFKQMQALAMKGAA